MLFQFSNIKVCFSIVMQFIYCNIFTFFPVNLASQTWKRLRSRYMREKRSLKTCHKSGAAATYRMPWKHMSSMAFLEPYLKERQ